MKPKRTRGVGQISMGTAMLIGLQGQKLKERSDET